ncbi:MAG TPA: hypothetical protein ENI65_06475 [Gammaproteobacteria bacterium]|nr:hypothetical protein [Gammaproteobacteria bacterium]
MDISPELGWGIALLVLGLSLIRLRLVISRHVVSWYRKIGVDIPEEKYAKQFVFIGVLLVILGFLVATGLFHFL